MKEVNKSTIKYVFVYRIKRFIKKRTGKLEEWIVENGEYTGHSYIYGFDELSYDENGKLKITPVKDKEDESDIKIRKLGKRYRLIFRNDDGTTDSVGLGELILVWTVITILTPIIIVLIIKEIITNRNP